MSMKDTGPDDSFAALLVLAPLGLNLLKSAPQPPPKLKVLASFLAQSKIDSILSSGGEIT